MCVCVRACVRVCVSVSECVCVCVLLSFLKRCSILEKLAADERSSPITVTQSLAVQKGWRNSPP